MAYQYPEVNDIFDKANTKMEKTISSLKNDYTALRAGRANPHILDKVTVDYYGTPTSLTQMANISTPEARVLTISVWDVSAMKEVEKAIINANLGLTPNNDGKIIRLVFPELTEERRRELAKQVKKLAEDAKVALRNERRDALEGLKKLNKDKVITDDDMSAFEKDFDKVMAKFTGEVEKLAKEKESEVMSV